MQSEKAESTSRAIIFARHIVGMAILALTSPLVYYSAEPISYWLAGWLAPLAISAIAFGLYALFFTQHAKHSWPRSFFILAWVLVALASTGPWLSMLRERHTTSQSTSVVSRTVSTSELAGSQKSDQDLMLEEYSTVLASTRLDLRSAGVNLSGEEDDKFDRAIRFFAQEAAQLGLEDRVGDIEASRYALLRAKQQMLQKNNQVKPQPTSKQNNSGALSTFNDLDAAGIGKGYSPSTPKQAPPKRPNTPLTLDDIPDGYFRGMSDSIALEPSATSSRR